KDDDRQSPRKQAGGQDEDAVEQQLAGLDLRRNVDADDADQFGLRSGRLRRSGRRRADGGLGVAFDAADLHAGEAVTLGSIFAFVILLVRIAVAMLAEPADGATLERRER